MIVRCIAVYAVVLALALFCGTLRPRVRVYPPKRLSGRGDMFEDLLSAALSEVDWYDLAGSFDDGRRMVAAEEE